MKDLDAADGIPYKQSVQFILFTFYGVIIFQIKNEFCFVLFLKKEIPA